ncbi:MAG: lipase maturation factor family protein [Gammaproteobacteria bacterium]|nr:lipase maturation factor family protein [Gammaproteobacteria bacterium]
MADPVPARPLFVYDGDCGICVEWVNYWRALTGAAIDYCPYQQAAGQYPDIAPGKFARAVHLFFPDSRIATGADATFQIYRGRFPQGLLAILYRWLPGFRPLSEAGYSFFADHRGLLAFLTHFFWGRNFQPPVWTATSWMFLRLLGLIYLGAFVSFGTQITGLIGSDGILPVTNFLTALREHFGTRAWSLAPMVFWFDAGDMTLVGTCVAGVLLALLVVCNVFATPALVALFLLYLSLVIAGQVFMAFQWDMLLLEAGALAIFLRGGSTIIVWLYRWLVFRFMFLGGMVKIISGDRTWDSLTALNYHFETQPLPNVAGWYAHQLPESALMGLTGATLIIELLLPFLIFAPRRPRMFAAWCFILLQFAILLTGNYNFFNLLTLCICLFLFDDAALRCLLPRRIALRLQAARVEAPGRIAGALTWLFAAIVLFSSSELLLSTISRGQSGPLSPITRAAAPCRCINNYGPFAVMTTVRHEIEIEGSNDGSDWRVYRFPHKPGPLNGIGGWIIPHQPRVDWQMWFAALSNPDREPWFRNFLFRLLQNSPAVTALLAENPFLDAPPRWVRARFYRYEFTTPEQRAETGDWWKRTLVGEYFPPASLPAD